VDKTLLQSRNLSTCDKGAPDTHFNIFAFSLGSSGDVPPSRKNSAHECGLSV